MTSSTKIPFPGGPGREKNPAELSKLYVDVLSALQGSGASLEIARFVFNNTGVTLTTCERLVEMRNNGIDENGLWDLLKSVFEMGKNA